VFGMGREGSKVSQGTVIDNVEVEVEARWR
jgi:hypothetical protein